MEARIASHPLGILPRGNSLLLDNYSRTDVMGNLGLLDDELLVSILEELNAKDLLAVAHTCKALYAYAHFDEIWKRIVYSQQTGSESPDLVWRGSWRNTALFRAKEGLDQRDLTNQLIDVSGKVFSDFLFRPYELSQINYLKVIEGLDSNLIPSFKEADMTSDKFLDHHSRPFIVALDKPIAGWTIESLVDKFGQEVFRQEYMDWPLATYVEYMRNNCDETPLYLFDCHSKAHAALEYETPLNDVFGHEHDFFELFGSDRPDHQWLIIGPERSGSTFHKDPNGTSAWNSVVTGQKYWIMFPPNRLPPGVWTDSEQSEVTAPVSLAEWFAGGFYKEALQTAGFCHAISRPGECMYVPSGWWHAVVNLTDSIAMTGNFVPRPQVHKVLNFLRNKSEQISGFKDPEGVADKFEQLLKNKDPSLFEGDTTSSLKRKWTDVAASPSTFTFSFSAS